MLPGTYLPTVPRSRFLFCHFAISLLKSEKLTIVEGLFANGSDPPEAAVEAEIRLGEPAVLAVHSTPQTSLRSRVDSS